ncbi:hypothetical protein CYMTET_43956 [Cymbomonas tetramitiformis]|uniref:Helicase C-terminal domain-containing protein n=1 Tax=Cymbomonas tetramitiformis TaxID=36881 RepID=A0AAE0C162_9CHLO|nr:hypothetical protein CYMTET_43956 [Cymbomonas tetramitiformis]
MSSTNSQPVEIRHFYIAVGRSELKLGTLTDLLTALSVRQGLSISICCSRDTLDAAVDTLRNHFSRGSRQAVASDTFGVQPSVQLECLHSDLSSSECQDILSNFRSAASKGSGMHVLGLTEVCLQVSAVEDSVLAVPLLINLDLPKTGKQYMQRATSILGVTQSNISRMGTGSTKGKSSNSITSKTVLTFVTPADVNDLRSLGAKLSLSVQEMPLDIVDNI